MLTDGCIYERKHGITCSLGCKDYNIIKFFRDNISPNRKIYNNKGFYLLSFPITSEQMCELEIWGLVKKKSLILSASEKLRDLPDNYFYQLLVGMIEGDGSVLNTTKYRKIYIYGTRNICEFLRDRTKSGIICKNRTIYRNTWGSLQADRLLMMLKKSKYMLLNRKWDKTKHWKRPPTLDKWSIQYNSCRNFLTKYKRWPIPIYIRSVKTTKSRIKESRLGAWLNVQRMKNRNNLLSEEQILKLERLGINWNPGRFNLALHISI
jgi:hypothetical protein